MITLDELEKRVANIERRLSAPCVYEARPYPYPIYANPPTHNMSSGAWCTTHGWDCPNAFRPQREK